MLGINEIKKIISYLIFFFISELNGSILSS